MPRSYCTCDTCSRSRDPRYVDDEPERVYNDDDDDDAGDPINGYSYKPTPVFHGDGPLFLGAEIEVSTPWRGANALARTAVDTLDGMGYLKEDGSIGDGFEIVTHPMSYAFAMDRFPWDLLPELAYMGAEATDDTGIHVHVSRAGFAGPCHMYRWMKLIYRNRRDVVRIARRTSPQWAPFREEDRRDIRDYAKKTQTRYATRYSAINVTNEDTLELRIFASSLDPVEVKASLGFVAASVEYTRQLSAHDITRNGGWTWPAFADWVAPKPEYEPFAAQLASLGMINKESLCAS